MTIKAKGRVRCGSLFSATVFFSAVCLLALLSTVAASEDHGNVSLRQVKQSEDEEESIWEPLPTNAKGIAGLVLAAFFIMVAAGSGLGGGGVLVPLYISFLDLNPMHAVALSNMTIFGSSLMNVIVNSRRKHPCANRKMINWEIVLLLEPCSILGTVIGGIMNKTFPVMLSVVLMVVFLTLTTIRTFRKAVKLYEIESSAFMRLGTIDDLSADIPAGHSRSLSLSPTLLPSHSEPLLSPAAETRRLCSSQRAMSFLDFSVDERNLMSPEYDSGDPNQSVRYMKAAKVNNTELTSIYMSESKTFQFCMIPMIVLQCIVIALFIVKQQSKCGSILFWAITFSFFPITILFMFGICKYLSKVHEERVTNGYEVSFSFSEENIRSESDSLSFSFGRNILVCTRRCEVEQKNDDMVSAHCCFCRHHSILVWGGWRNCEGSIADGAWHPSRSHYSYKLYDDAFHNHFCCFWLHRNE